MANTVLPAGLTAVAFSGGADSVYLLLWAKAQTKKLLALHFNHNMRGELADRDEAFCREFCAEHGIEFMTAKATTPLTTEEAARDARFAFFSKVHETKPFTSLLTGHHANDVAETMLMRLTRSTSTSGLCAPRPVQKLTGVPYVIVRPLLELSKQEIVTDLKSKNIPWCEDHTNTQDTYFRNRIRNHIVPKLEEVSGKNVLSSMLATRELLQEDDDALNEWTHSVYKVVDGLLDLSVLQKCPMAVKRRAFQRWLLETDLKMSKAAVDKLLTTLDQKYLKHSCGNGYLIQQKGKIRFASKDLPEI